MTNSLYFIGTHTFHVRFLRSGQSPFDTLSHELGSQRLLELLALTREMENLIYKISSTNKLFVSTFEGGESGDGLVAKAGDRDI